MSNPGGSWGQYPRLDSRLVALRSRFEPLPQESGRALPYGNGRSYGDVCQNDGGLQLWTRRLDRFIDLDVSTGQLECEAGLQLSDLIEHTLPRGWFPAVTPGTQFVTVGGAIANDVHGKNHHRVGSFGHHLLEFELLRSDGRTLHCSREENRELFHATIGGLGLTGLIRRARLQLCKVPGPWLGGESLRLGSLADFFALSAESDSTHEHTVAWVDCTARGPSLGRGVFHRANWIQDSAALRRRRSMHVPLTPPLSLVNRLSTQVFNTLFFHTQRARVQRRWPYDRFFYPLDGLLEWNRIYGPRGFLQYQCVLPTASAYDGVRELLNVIAASGQSSFLTVLKKFGEQPPAGLMSFARPGITLAVDFPNRGSATMRLLDTLDAITRLARGAVYPAKDARMSPAAFAAFFPQWRELERYRDPALSSSFWRRVTHNL